MEQGKGRKRLPPSTSLSLPQKYPNGHSSKPKKLEDLHNMIPFLPTEHRQFYLDLYSNAPRRTSGESSDDDDDDE